MTNTSNSTSKTFKLKAFLGCLDFKCVNCGTDLFCDGAIFCDKCLPLITLNNGNTCNKCGAPINADNTYCGKCGKMELRYDRSYSPLVLEGVVQRLVHSLKFGGYTYIAVALARIMADKARQVGLTPDIVTYVPQSKREAFERGYNQAQLLAKAFCDTMGIHEPQSVLLKIKETERQEKLDLVGRQINLHNAFNTDKKSDVKDKTVLVIDDVLTTGSTINEAARALKKAGAKYVYGLTASSRRERLQFE